MMLDATSLENALATLEHGFARAWRAARGGDAGRITSAWGQSYVVLIVEDALFVGERVLAQDDRGSDALRCYLIDLLALVVEEQAAALADLVDKPVIATSLSVNLAERLVIALFRMEN
jgi:hypothetical protein